MTRLPKQKANTRHAGSARSGPQARSAPADQPPERVTTKPLTGRARSRSQITFYILFTLTGALVFWLVRAFLGVIALSFVTVIIIRPLYVRLLRWCRGWEKVAMTLTILVGLALPLLLFWSIGWMVVAQAHEFINLVQSTNQVELLINSIAADLQPFFDSNAPLMTDLLTQLRQMGVTVMSGLAGLLVSVGMSIPTLLVHLFIYLVLVGALLPSYDHFAQKLKQLSPLDDDLEDLFLHKINSTVRSMFAGIFLIAIAQGLVMGLFFWLAGLPYAPLWMLVSIVAATLPLGASIVAIPAAIAQFVMGDYSSAIVILAGYLLVVSNLDLFIRSKLASRQTYGGFALMVLSLLGGYQLFGLFGIFYGPVLMVLFLTMLDVYQTHFAPHSEDTNLADSQSATDPDKA